MLLEVITPDETLFKGNISHVVLPGLDGSFGILKGHAPLVSALAEGPVEIVKGSGEKLTFKIEKGFIEVLRNEVSLLVQGYQA